MVGLTPRWLVLGTAVSVTIDSAPVGATVALIMAEKLVDGDVSKAVDFLLGLVRVLVGAIGMPIGVSCVCVCVIAAEAMLVFHFPVSEADQAMPLPLPPLFVALSVPIPLISGHQVGFVPCVAGLMISVTAEPT